MLYSSLFLLYLHPFVVLSHVFIYQLQQQQQQLVLVYMYNVYDDEGGRRSVCSEAQLQVAVAVLTIFLLSVYM